MFFDRFHRHACGHHEHGLHGHGHHHHHDPRMAMFNPFDDEDETCFHMAGRHHGGPFGAGRGGRGDFFGNGGRPPFLRGRKFSADELQLLLLALLEENASYGYELIKRLDEKSAGFYKPSPGVVYPALTWLEDVGYVTVTQEGTRKRYALAAEGTAWLAENRAMADAIMARLDHFAQQMNTMTEAMREAPTDFDPALRDAVAELRHQIHARHQSDPEVQRQMVTVLQTAIEALKKLPL
ncbi:PadR family transcriptional regulator [Kluyvera ascorbata]|uniref:PadR family transcriptional regulator n=1 Tax=Kluyvera ascorbata TaxID=51288 RepID=UPI00200D0459|nr:PadR family transcriptional regulator [Kluyvera ascorbata]